MSLAQLMGRERGPRDSSGRGCPKRGLALPIRAGTYHSVASALPPAALKETELQWMEKKKWGMGVDTGTKLAAFPGTGAGLGQSEPNMGWWQAWQTDPRPTLPALFWGSPWAPPCRLSIGTLVPNAGWGLKRPMGVTGEAPLILPWPPLILPWPYLCSHGFVHGCPFMEDTTPFSIPVGSALLWQPSSHHQQALLRLEGGQAAGGLAFGSCTPDKQDLIGS